MIHDIFARFYRDKYKDKYLYRLTEDEVINYFISNINPKFKDFISDNIIKTTVR